MIESFKSPGKTFEKGISFLVKSRWVAETVGDKGLNGVVGLKATGEEETDDNSGQVLLVGLRLFMLVSLVNDADVKLVRKGGACFVEGREPFACCIVS